MIFAWGLVLATVVYTAVVIIGQLYFDCVDKIDYESRTTWKNSRKNHDYWNDNNPWNY